jgi:hypothetical protein
MMDMKYPFILLCVWLLQTQAAVCQPENASTKNINKICRQIAANTSGKEIVAKGDVSHLQGHGANKVLTGFYNNGALVKMTLRGQDNEGIELFTYYYDQHRLICVYNEFSGPRYDSSGKRVAHEYENNFYGWYYFRQGKLVFEESTGHNRFEDDALDAGELLPKEAKACRRLLP